MKFHHSNHRKPTLVCDQVRPFRNEIRLAFAALVVCRMPQSEVSVPKTTVPTAEIWEKIIKCSRPTAVGDISDLIEKGVLIHSVAGGRSASYRLAEKTGEK
jgi:hypothetical protein